MTVKRETKRTIRKITSTAAIVIIAVVICYLLFLTTRAIFPLLTFGGTRETLIRPIGEVTTLEDLKRRLSDKNIIFEKLEASSESGNFEGVIKEGPIVRFSQSQDAKWQVGSLALILQRTTVNNKKPILIDLTHNRPIVKF
jgi:hypothetical protein